VPAIPAVRLTEMGMDSLMAVELQTAIYLVRSKRWSRKGDELS